MSTSARHRARELLVQALYQQQLTGHSAAELADQFAEQAGFASADGEYFQTLLRGILADTNQLDEIIAAHAARDLEQLDPVGRAILWLACYELICCPAVPTRVVMNEAIELANMGKGSLVCSMVTANDQSAREFVLGAGTHHGRILILNEESAKASTGHGSPMPLLVHGGPGRAGGGEEMGGEENRERGEK